MPKIKMLERSLGADSEPDGKNKGVKVYEAGQEYDLGESLACDFVNSLKVAKYVEAEEKKKLPSAPENKAAKAKG